MTPEREQVLGQTHQTPRTTDGVQAAQQQPTETPRVFALATHRFHEYCTLGVPCMPFGRTHIPRRTIQRDLALAALGGTWVVGRTLPAPPAPTASVTIRMHYATTVGPTLVGALQDLPAALAPVEPASQEHFAVRLPILQDIHQAVSTLYTTWATIERRGDAGAA